MDTAMTPEAWQQVGASPWHVIEGAQPRAAAVVSATSTGGSGSLQTDASEAGLGGLSGEPVSPPERLYVKFAMTPDSGHACVAIDGSYSRAWAANWSRACLDPLIKRNLPHMHISVERLTRLLAEALENARRCDTTGQNAVRAQLLSSGVLRLCVTRHLAYGGVTPDAASAATGAVSTLLPLSWTLKLEAVDPATLGSQVLTSQILRPLMGAFATLAQSYDVLVSQIAAKDKALLQMAREHGYPQDGKRFPPPLNLQQHVNELFGAEAQKARIRSANLAGVMDHVFYTGAVQVATAAAPTAAAAPTPTPVPNDSQCNEPIMPLCDAEPTRHPVSTECTRQKRPFEPERATRPTPTPPPPPPPSAPSAPATGPSDKTPVLAKEPSYEETAAEKLRRDEMTQKEAAATAPPKKKKRKVNNAFTR